MSGPTLDDLNEAASDLVRARERRDELVAQLSEQHTKTAVAHHANISEARVRQIVKAANA